MLTKKADRSIIKKTIERLERDGTGICFFIVVMIIIYLRKSKLSSLKKNKPFNVLLQ